MKPKLRALFVQPSGFYRRLWLLAAPIILQNLITTSLGFVDTFMVGLLGNAEMAAVNAANTPIFITQVVIFGFQSGMAVLVSQYWGRRDMEHINRVMGVAMAAITGFSTLLALVLFLFPEQVLHLITPNVTLVTIGTPYLQIVGFSYIFNGISSIYTGAQRSTENPKLGMQIMAVSMVTNTFLNYCLIFGKLGAPHLGVTGAAIATLTSRVVEFVIAAAAALRSRRLPLMPRYLFHPGKAVVRSFVKYSSPVICNETLWSLGTSMLVVIIGHMDNSQDMLAAHALVGYIDKFATVICFGLAAASAVMVGKEIGENRTRDQVYRLSCTLLAVSALVGLCSGSLLLILTPTFFRGFLFPLFHLTPGAVYAATCMVCILGVYMPLRSFDVTNITGILRAGGDVRAATVIDLSPLWCLAIPLAALAALVLELDVFWVCMAIYAENLAKAPVGLWRFHSRKWINDVTGADRPSEQH